MLPGEAVAVPHCDCPECSYGCIMYVCPVCRRTHEDYGDLWDAHDDICMHPEKVILFTCNCKAALIFTWNEEECEFQVRQPE